MINENINTEIVLDEMERKRWKRTGQTLAKDWRLYVLLAPTIVFLLMFRYQPMIGLLETFRHSTELGSVFEMPWTGLQNFQTLFNNAEFWVAVRNTFVTSMYGLFFGFPIPIIIALLFSEVKNNLVRSALQVAVYLPRFISTVVMTSIVIMWTANATEHASAGIITRLFASLGLIAGEHQNVLNEPRFFRMIFQITGIWEGAGFGSIVFFAAIMSISPTNYEAAKIDGANKFQQIRYVTFPGMAPTLTIMLIMRIGAILSVGFETVLLLYNHNTMQTADVISTFVIRQMTGAAEAGTPNGVAVAADLFNSFIAMILVLGANSISRRVSDTSLF